MAKGLLVAGGVAATGLVAAWAAQSALLQAGLNRYALRDAGLSITAAESLAVDVPALFGGRVAISATGLELRHEALPHRLRFDRLDVVTPFDGREANARFAIGTHAGRLAVVRPGGRLQSADLAIGDGRPSSLVMNWRAGEGPRAMPEIRVDGRTVAPILAQLLGLPPQDLGALPDRIEATLASTDGRQVTGRYTLAGRDLVLSGEAAVDVEASTLRSRGRLELREDEPEPVDARRVEALRGQLRLLVDDGVPWLRRLRIDAIQDVVLKEADAVEAYRLTLTTPGTADGSLGRLAVVSLDPAGATPDRPLLDAALAAGTGAERLVLAGTTAVLEPARPVRIALNGAELDSMDVAIDATADGGLGLQLAFDDSGSTLRLRGAVAGVAAGPGAPRRLADLLALIGAFDPAGRRLALSGNAALDGDVVRFDGLEATIGNHRVRVGGTLGGATPKLDVQATSGALDRAALERVAEVVRPMLERADAAPIAPTTPATPVDLGLRVERLTWDSLVAEGLEVGWPHAGDARLRVAALVVSGERRLSAVDLALPQPLAAGATLRGTATGAWGRTTLEYRPRDATSLATLAGAGGRADVTLDGATVVVDVPPADSDTPVQVQATVADLARVPAIAALAGENARHLPPGRLDARATLTRAGQLLGFEANHPELQLRSTALRDGALRVSVSGRHRVALALVPGALDAIEGDHPLRANATWRQRGGAHEISEIDATLGPLALTGALRADAAGTSGRVVVRADRLRATTALFPAVGELPGKLLDAPVNVPIEIGTEAARLRVAVRDARFGPLEASGTAVDAGERWTGNVALDGPVAQQLLVDAPAWLQDVLGARQQVATDLELAPGRALTLRNLRLRADGVGAAGELVVPLTGGGAAWDTTTGRLAGNLTAIRYGEITFPEARWETVLSADRALAARVDFDLKGGGTLATRLALVRPAAGANASTGTGGGSGATVNAGAADGRIELAAERVDLAELCRRNGLRLFGAGRLDGRLVGTVPAAALESAGDADRLVEALLKRARAEGRLSIRDGVLVDVDLAARANGADGGVGDGLYTRFTEASGDLVLQDGTLRVDRGRLVTPEYGLDVGGTVQLPDLDLNLLVKGEVTVLSRISTGQSLMKAPIPPLLITDRPSKPGYRFLPGAGPSSTALNTAVSGAKSVTDSLDRTQAKVDKFFSDRFFRKIVGDPKAKAAGTPDAAQPDGTADAGSAAEAAPRSRRTDGICGLPPATVRAN